jgi:hypothetical protein
MVWATSALPPRSVFQAWAVVERPWPTTPMGSMFIKVVKLWLTKNGGERGAKWNFGERCGARVGGTKTLKLFHFKVFFLSVIAS